MPQYEALLALYQARNAVQIARADGAGEYAADSLNKGQQFLNQAEAEYSKKEFTRVTNLSRQSVQAASDARAIATSRKPQPQRP
jgi:demethoxyubiquinone hydroxylase (CLK1/Coq7/Cat5 family)